MAERHSGEYQVAELPCGGLDDGGVVVANKHSSCERSGQEPETREGYRDDGLGVGPLDELGGDLVARCGTGLLINWTTKLLRN
jgi:hypothetical protein